MCGLAGIFGYGAAAPEVDRAELLRIRERMKARGPDGDGLWFSNDRQVGLAHQRLAIIDLSNGGAQPMSDPVTGNQIVFNGEIYNFQALRAELEASGEQFVSSSDTEVILKLYRILGIDFLRRLRGMYSLAIFDKQKNGLFLARDTLGIKPLYYADDGKTIRFASQVKALLRGSVDRSPEPAGYVGFLLWGAVPEPYTMYKGIRSLPAGHSMWVDKFVTGIPRKFDGISERLIEASQNPAKLSYDDALDGIDAVIRDSVAAHQVADVPVGLFLSAGLDSLMLANIASGSTTKLRTLTIGFAAHINTAADETRTAAQVACRIGATHQERIVERSDYIQDRQSMLDQMDQPSIDGVNTWFVSKLCAEAGIKVSLSGLGGDEIFGSYSSFSQLPKLLKFLRFTKDAPGFANATRRFFTPIARALPSPKYVGLLEYGNSIERAYLLRRALFMPWELPSILGSEFAQEGLNELQPLSSLRRMVDGINNERLAISSLELGQYLRNQLLRDSDWAGMAHSIEIRVPFADIELISKLAAIFASFPNITKQQIAERIDPNIGSISRRPKTGFSVPTAVQGGSDLNGSDYYRKLALALINRQRFAHLN